MASSWQSWIQASHRNSYPRAHLTGDFYFSSGSETLLVFGEHWASRLLNFPCATPKVPWPGAIVWKIDYDSQSSFAFLKINTFLSCDQRLAQGVLLLSINFHYVWKLTSLGAPNMSSSSLHLPLVNLPKMSFQRTKLQHSRGDEKLLFTSYCLAKVSL